MKPLTPEFQHPLPYEKLKKSLGLVGPRFENSRGHVSLSKTVECLNQDTSYDYDKYNKNTKSKIYKNNYKNIFSFDKILPRTNEESIQFPSYMQVNY